MEIFTHALSTVTKATTITHTIPLVPEASARRYYRLLLADGSRLVGVTDSPEGIRLFKNVQTFLSKNTIPVPEIIFAEADDGVMLQQDLGDMSLNHALTSGHGPHAELYGRAVFEMLRWQRLGDYGNCPAFKLSFDVEKLMFEFDFFITHTLLGHYAAKVSEGDLSRLRGDFLIIAETLAAPEKKVFTHRDYHSRNIMIFEDTYHIIDFQDARLGLMQYDLCSLVCDAYASIEPKLRDQLVEYAYAEGKAIHGQTRLEFQRYFALSAFQRVVKAMGTFGRQATLGRKDYELCLPPAAKILAEISEADPDLRLLTARLARMTGWGP